VDQNPDKLPDTRMNEALSALMDGEVDELELRRILRELPGKPELYGAWKRYHVVRAGIQQDVHCNPSVDLLSGVQARLAAEQQPDHQDQLGRWNSMLRSRIVRYLGQGAIAASVAVAALMGVSLLQTADVTESSQSIAAAGANAPALNGEFAAEQLSTTVSFDAEAYNRLQQAVYREFSGLPLPVRNVVPLDPEVPQDNTLVE
jgi:sigma-E factor negative regulatory protein RseA